MSLKAQTNLKKKGKGRKYTILVRVLLIAFLIILAFQSVSRESLTIIASNLDKRFQFWRNKLNALSSQVNHGYRNSTIRQPYFPIVKNLSPKSVTRQINNDVREYIPVTAHEALNPMYKLGNASYPSPSPSRTPSTRRTRVSRKKPIPLKQTRKPKPRPVKRTRKPRGPDDWMYDNVLNLDEEWYLFAYAFVLIFASEYLLIVSSLNNFLPGDTQLLAGAEGLRIAAFTISLTYK